MMPGDRRPIISLDHGERRIGVAVSESLVIANPLDALAVRGKRTALDGVQRLVEQYGAGTVLVGLPLLEDGREGTQAEKARAFGRSLQRRLPAVRVVYLDERYTSAEAEEIVGRRAVAPGRVDSVAAAVILQEFLDHLGRMAGGPGAPEEPGTRG